MITRTFLGRYSSLEPLSQFVIEQATAAGLGEAEIYGIQLAVDEAATNIIEHGYGGEDRGEIICQCEAFRDGLRVILKDRAQPFQPEMIPQSTSNASLEDVKPRGLGLFFIYKMMDEVHFDIDPKGGNTLIMVKRKKKPPSK